MLSTAYSNCLKQKMLKGALLSLLVTSTGCALNHDAGRAYQSIYTDRVPVRYSQSASSVGQNSAGGMPSSSEMMLAADELKRKQTLQRQYSKWAGTPYRFGGQSYSGIDCSALMMRVFSDAFNRQLPRTTIQQVKMGKAVSKRQLEIGDLVFFKTGWNRRHVGVYMGKTQFLHASVSKGVTISSLEESYWSKRYWQSRRLF